MDNPLVNLKGISKPLTKLIDVLASGIGTLYAPFGTVRNAKADAKAMVIRANAENEIASLQDRAQSRLLHQEALRQQNIEIISSKAAQELPGIVSDEPVNQDWLAQFLTRAQDVSDEDMQAIWARILAGEVATPGTYSKRTLQFLESLDKIEAEAFTELCAFTLQDTRGWHMLYENKYIKEESRKAMGHPFVEHFIGIGLISPELYWPGNSDITGTKVKYFDKEYAFLGPPAPEPKFGLQKRVAYRQFTQIGQQLAQIAGAKEIEGFITNLSEAFEMEVDVKIRPLDS